VEVSWQTRDVTLRAGDVLGRYQVLCPIGAGGMAEVYAARVVGAESFAKLVALKVMLPHLSRDPKFARMFVDEARLAAHIESAHVVTTLDLGKDQDDRLYQAMELVLGASLRQLLDATETPMPLGPALSILAELARGLADAHAARGPDGTPLGLVHRDVSPHNVLVGVDGRTRLSDFGVARAAASVSATESGELKGKLAYAAPEQLRGEVADARSDVFALGVVCWEVLRGRRLFVAENPLALVDMMMTRPIPRLDAERPELGAPIADVVADMLVREREARTVSAADVASRLEDLARGAQGSASRDVIGALVRDRAGAPLLELESRIRAQSNVLAPPTTLASAIALPPRRDASLSRVLGASVIALLVVVLTLIVWRGPGDATTSAADPPATSTDAIEPAVAIEPPRTLEPPPEEIAANTSTVEPETAIDPRPSETEPGPRTPRVRPPRSAQEDPDAGIRATPTVTPPTTTTAPSPTHEPEGGLLGVEDFDRGTEHRSP